MPFRKNLSLDAFIIAIFIGALDICIVAPSLTVIAADLGFPVRWVIWVIALHLAVFVLALPLMETWGVRFGWREWFFVALFLYGAGSFIAGGSTTWTALMAGRVIQALGAGGVVPQLSAEIRRLSENRRKGWRVAVHGVLAALLIALPLYSSAVTHFFSWRWIFWTKIPAVLVVAILTFRLARGGRFRSKPYQVHGVFYFGAILLSAMVAVSQLDPSLGWAALIDPSVLPFAVLVIGLPVLMFMADRQSSRPFFASQLFTDIRLVGLHTVVALAGCTWAAAVLVPGWMVEVFQQPPGSGGPFLSIVAASAWLSLPLARWTTRYWGYQGVLAVGFFATAFAYFTLALALEPVPLIAVLIVLGFGISFTLTAPVHELLFGVVPYRQVKNGLMVIGMFRAAGGALGLILIGLSFHRAPAFTGWIASAQGLPALWSMGYQMGMLTVSGVSVVGLILSLTLPSPGEDPAETEGERG
ncbi:MFS transporter [Paludifilum halophilum]|nr:MFS transporter [Paludifilum halophilum]